MTMDLRQVRKSVESIQAKYLLCQEMARREQQELDQLETGLEDVKQAQIIAQFISQTLQQQAHEQIANVVSRCLAAVFPEDPYEFKIRFDLKRGKTEATLVFLRDGIELDDPLNEVGGGVIDVAAFALRLSSILLMRPRMRRLLVLDEPFSNIRGEGNRNRTRDLLQRLSDELDVQIIINTDILSYRLGKVLELPI